MVRLTNALFLISILVPSGSLNARASQMDSPRRLPLYSMGGRAVEVEAGNTPRTPQISHKSHELDDERSSPRKDPSPVTGFHLVLTDFEPQRTLAAEAALYKLNPFDPKGALLGNLSWNRGSDLYSSFRSNDPLVPFLRSRQAAYLYGRIDPTRGPALVNSDYEFAGISDRAFGYCWGLSTLNRYFAYAAFFDPTLPAPDVYVPGGLARNERWFRFYESIIDDIMDGIPRVIPGFHNFSEFSAVPEIEMYLKLKVMDAWALRAISAGSLKTFFNSTTELDDGGVNELVRSLARRLNRGEIPKILFTAADSRTRFGGSLDVHSVLVNGVHLSPDGTGRIDLWDINFYFEDLIHEPKFIEIRRNRSTGRRELHYGVWFEQKKDPVSTYRSSLLGKVRISPEDASEMGQLIENLRVFCSKRHHLKYCQETSHNLME
jgi:hypothetical protein